MNLFVKLKQFFLDRSSSVYPVEKKINYIFHNKDYLNQAFTHKSLDTSPRSNYERLEFLGDSILGFAVCLVFCPGMKDELALRRKLVAARSHKLSKRARIVTAFTSFD